MIFIEHPSNDAAFFFATEEYFAGIGKMSAPVFLLWQTKPTAMLGCNQVLQAEINEVLAKENDVSIVRRRSGGGTIFTDPGTFLYTIILPWDGNSDNKELLREYLVKPLLSVLRSFGIPAQLEGRNDILLDGRKISGLAQYVQKDRIVSHGSLLYNADLELLGSLLVVDPEKIKSKSITSVRKRVTNLCEYMKEAPSTPEFRKVLSKRLREALKSENYDLSENQLENIEAIRLERYSNDDWTYGHNPSYEFNNSKRYPGGKLDISYITKKGRITDFRIRGDFMGLSEISELEKLFINQLPERSTFEKIISENSDIIRNCLGSLSGDDIINCI
ncbi:MAG: lipoate--protein ligase [Lachnospiraceae bacterium]|jgi:lipoate-protein ligase A|nr:lipoate--protein ligase [Lachnospiraceae bacterium]